MNQHTANAMPIELWLSECKAYPTASCPRMDGYMAGKSCKRNKNSVRDIQNCKNVSLDLDPTLQVDFSTIVHIWKSRTESNAS
jgi:hypothetical protein